MELTAKFYGRAIAAARVLKGISQNELAQITGLNVATIKNIELGKNARTESLLKIQTALEKELAMINLNN